MLTVILFATWGAATIAVAKLLCRRWINHLSLYSGVWTLSLCTYECRLIGYNYIKGEAWVFIFAAWTAVYLGSACGRLFVSPPARQYIRVTEVDKKSLAKAIVLLSIAGLASSVVLARHIIEQLDSNLFLALLAQGNKIYSMRFDGDLSGLAYVGFLPYAASALAGSHAAISGKLSSISVLPLLALSIDGVLSMQRAGMVIGAILFVAALHLTPSQLRFRWTRAQKVAVVVLLVMGSVGVTAVRGVSSVFESQGSTLNEISDRVPSLPSVYMYLSAPPAGLSAYLENPGADGREFWGRYTFAPVNRLLAKFGADTYVPYYAEFYSTPVSINTCTFIREIYSDFGGIGVIVFPFVLGGGITILESHKAKLPAQVVLAHLYVVILFSFSCLILITGYWYVSLVVGTGAAMLLHRKVGTRQAGT